MNYEETENEADILTDDFSTIWITRFAHCIQYTFYNLSLTDNFDKANSPIPVDPHKKAVPDLRTVTSKKVLQGITVLLAY